MSLLITLCASLVLISFAVYLRFSLQNFFGDFWGVTCANLLASIVLGLIYKLKTMPNFMEISFFQFIVALCFCGALSTFSSYIQIFYKLLENENYTSATSFVLLNNLGCLAAFVVITKLF